VAHTNEPSLRAIAPTPATRAIPPRRTGHRLGALAAAALVAGCHRPAGPELEADPAKLLVGIVATCASAVRDAQIRRAGHSTWEPVLAGAMIRAGDEVRTGALSTARLAFLAGGGLELEDSAAVIVDVEPSEDRASRGAPPRAMARAAAGESRVSVKGGVVRGFLPRADGSGGSAGLVLLSGDGSEVLMAAVPGQDEAAFRLARAERGTELAMLQGTASVKGPRGQTTLGAGRVAVVRDGELADGADLIEAPTSLEPGTEARVQFAPALAVRLRWSHVPGATAYRIQVARDLAFHDVEALQVVDGTDYVFLPTAGVHAWRVAARDAKGRFGEYGFVRRIHCEEQAPHDLLLKPADGAAVKTTGASARVAFSWESSGDERAYRVVVARSPDLLVEPVTSVVVTARHAVLELAGPGDYWWGVYVDSDRDPRPLFTRPRILSVTRAAQEARATAKAAEPRPRPRAPRPEPAPAVEVPAAVNQWGG
jgi:hypothetical protein